MLGLYIKCKILGLNIGAEYVNRIWGCGNNQRKFTLPSTTESLSRYYFKKTSVSKKGLAYKMKMSRMQSFQMEQN